MWKIIIIIMFPLFTALSFSGTLAGEATSKIERALRMNHCPDPPADAQFVALKENEKCEGVKVIDGKKCCCRCAGASNTDAAGYYCNPNYCAIQALKTTMSATGTIWRPGGSSASTPSPATASFISTWHSIPNLL